jgi:glutathione synthase/RimK-type ligase-like ATP-grasp enzyme
MAVAAVNTLGLDFGAVDIAECGDHAVVFEVNTAPGIDGTTVSKYNTFLKEFFNV